MTYPVDAVRAETARHMAEVKARRDANGSCCQPLVDGGQGRTRENVEASGRAFMVAAIGLVLIVMAALAAYCLGWRPTT